MATTTPGLIRDDMITEILDVSPSFAEHRTDLWHRMRTVSEVPGAAMRAFFIENMQSIFLGGDEGGIFDIGVRSKAYQTIVWTSYRGLSADHYQSIVAEDSDQLLHAFTARVGTLAGLWAVPEDLQSWIDGAESTDGARWGGHSFVVHYLADTTT